MPFKILDLIVQYPDTFLLKQLCHSFRRVEMRLATENPDSVHHPMSGNRW